MFRYEVDPDWYEKYWFSDRPPVRRRPFSASLARFGVVVALVVGGSAMLSHYHANDVWHGYQDWEHE
jgi:hypothetical protein